MNIPTRVNKRKPDVRIIVTDSIIILEFKDGKDHYVDKYCKQGQRLLKLIKP